MLWIHPSILQKADIDSLIWVGCRVQFHGVCRIYLMPVYSRTPSFAKSNQFLSVYSYPSPVPNGKIIKLIARVIPHMDFGMEMQGSMSLFAFHGL